MSQDCLKFFPRIGAFSFPEAIDTIEVHARDFKSRDFAIFSSTKLSETPVPRKLSNGKPFREQGTALPFKLEGDLAIIESKSGVWSVDKVPC